MNSDNYLVIGLGSMGKRRVRCLLNLGIAKESIIGFDLRSDRRAEVEQKYSVRTVADISEVDFDSVKAVVVSLPPDKHAIGAKIAIDHDKPVFIEANVLLEDAREIEAYNHGKVLIAPSSTLVYHPMIQDIANIIRSGKYGKVCNFSYHSGQYLPDWHPWENVKDFYVGNRATGGAREIVPFEFTWLVDLFGFPKEVKGHFRKTIDLGCNIEDSYTCSINYEDMIGVMIVDVVARYAVRNLVINLEKAQIQWRWDKKQIEVYEADTKRWLYYSQPEFVANSQYNANIGEQMYINEIKTFLAAVDGKSSYSNTIEKDIKVLQLLETIEDSDGGFKRGYLS